MNDDFPGVTARDVERIAEQQTAEIVRAVDEMKATIDQSIRFAIEVIGRLGAQTRDLTVERLDLIRNELAIRFDALCHTSERLLELAQQTYQLTEVQLVAANAQLGVGNVQLRRLRRESSSGLAKVSEDIEHVDAELRRATMGVVQMEVIRLLTEVQGPIDRIHRFAEEIEQRFAKAVENIYFVRGQHDGLHAAVLDEFERKLRQIGEHIYRIYEEEFRAYAENPLTLQPQLPLSLPLELDDAQVAARTRILGEASARLQADILEPLLDAARHFERAVAAEFACGLVPGTDELALPLAFLVYESEKGAGRAEFIGDARVVSASSEAAGSRLAMSEDGECLAEALGRNAERILTPWTGRSLTSEEIATVKRHLRDFAAQGHIDPSLLPGYEAYLDSGVLEVPRSEAESFEMAFEETRD